MAAPAAVDGRSLAPLLHGQKVTDWRAVALVEHRGPLTDRTDPDAPAPRSGNPNNYEAIRGLRFLYVQYSNGDKEYRDLAADPDELGNGFPALSSEEKASLHATLEAVKICRGADSCRAAEGSSRGAMPKGR